MQDLTTSQLNKNESLVLLHDLLECAKLYNVDFEFSDDMSMREYRTKLEKHIIEEIHPYRIYDNSKVVPGQWATYLPDPSNPRGRKPLRRNSYEKLCDALIEYYTEQMHLNMELSYLFNEWIIFRRDETSAKKASIRKFISLWKVHIRYVEVDGKVMEAYRVNEITPKLLYRFFRKITKDRTYTKQMVNDIRCVLSGMFSYAIERDIIQMNPIRDVDLRRLSYKPNQDKTDNVFTKDDVWKLLNYLEDDTDPYSLAIQLDFNLFARVGEIAGLMWENVDFENRTVYICHQINYEPELNDDLTFSEKKMVTEDYLKGCTSHGYRTEYLTDEAVAILKKAKTVNPDGKYVFMPFGKPIVTLTFNKRLRKYCEAAGIPYHSSHKIRFYVASTAFNGDNLLQVSRMMGHSQVSTTLHYLRDVNQDKTCPDVFENLGKPKNG